MKYNLEQLNTLVDLGYLRTSIKGNLILFNYTEKTTFAQYWEPLTLASRGLILNKHTGELVAKPFSKFFNLGEHSSTYFINLPNTAYEISEKIDGSLLIIFYNPETEQWDCATRGSFYSDQALKGQELLKNLHKSKLNPMYTYLCELIYPENKIIVNYGNKEALVLLGVYNIVTGDEMFNIELPIQFEMPKTYSYSILEMLELQKTIPKDEEGFVIRYSNGLRVKIKGHEYLKIAKILANMTPISLWDVMNEDGKVDEKYLSQIPEELKGDYEPIVEILETNYQYVLEEIKHDIYTLIPTHLHANMKDVGLFLQTDTTVKHKNAVFCYLKNNHKAVNKYIKTYIRPDGNKLLRM